MARRLTTNQEIAGSTPASVNFLVIFVIFVIFFDAILGSWDNGSVMRLIISPFFPSLR